MATHDPIFAQLTCDYYVVLSRGKIVLHGDRETLLSSPQILANVFGVSFRKTSIDGIGEILLPVYSY
jgi:ABC-type cobalamin/Fe3+-siderophores transport system ATPase subunit